MFGVSVFTAANGVGSLRISESRVSLSRRPVKVGVVGFECHKSCRKPLSIVKAWVGLTAAKIARAMRV